jgi:hypothetical protein
MPRILLRIIKMIISREPVIMGSCKFTKALQEKNAENVLITHITILATLYTQNWQVHTKHIQPYVGREVRQ